MYDYDAHDVTAMMQNTQLHLHLHTHTHTHMLFALVATLSDLSRILLRAFAFSFPPPPLRKNISGQKLFLALRLHGIRSRGFSLLLRNRRENGSFIVAQSLCFFSLSLSFESRRCPEKRNLRDDRGPPKEGR